MTVLTVALMLAAFAFPRTLVDAQEEQARQATHDRVLVLPKNSWSDSLPARYAEEVGARAGIRRASGVRWADFQLPGKDNVFFASNGVDPGPFLAMHPELVTPEAEQRAFLADQQSALVSRDLARRHAWKLGDRVIFKSRSQPTEWAVTVAGIYEPTGGEWTRNSLWVHYAFLNRSLPEDQRDKIMFVIAQVSEPHGGGRIAKDIDLHFDAEPVPTRSLDDALLTMASVGRIGAVLGAMDLISYLILFVVLAILLNTLSLNVRERTRELGVLRALGFGPVYVYGMVLGEAALLGLAGSTLGLGLSYALLEGLVGPYLEESLGFQPLEVPLRVALTAFAAGLGLALLSAALPARQVRRLEVREALGHVA